jgi:hypothetical protein
MDREKARVEEKLRKVLRHFHEMDSGQYEGRPTRLGPN